MDDIEYEPLVTYEEEESNNSGWIIAIAAIIVILIAGLLIYNYVYIPRKEAKESKIVEYIDVIGKQAIFAEKDTITIKYYSEFGDSYNILYKNNAGDWKQLDNIPAKLIKIIE